MVGVDQAHRQQAPAQQQHGAGLPGEAEMPGHITGKHPAGQLHQRIALADRRLAARAASAQQQPADDRDVLPSTDLVSAVRAAGVRQQQVEALGWLLAVQFQHLTRLGLPVALHHDRQAVDDHVDEAADQQAQDGCAENKGQRVAGQKLENTHLADHAT
ncbi:hypothetical protein D3C84_811510 [compost metagenome]